MNLELGTDIVSLKRIIRVSQRLGFRFFERFLLPNEIILASKKIQPKEIQAKHLPTHLPMMQKPLIFHVADAMQYQQEVSCMLENLRADFHTQHYRMESIAGFWAIKEACAKALGTGISSQLGFHDMCIYKDMRGKPYIALSDRAYRHFQPKSIAISVTHDIEAAFAVCAVSL